MVRSPNTQNSRTFSILGIILRAVATAWACLRLVRSHITPKCCSCPAPFATFTGECGRASGALERPENKSQRHCGFSVCARSADHTIASACMRRLAIQRDTFWLIEKCVYSYMYLFLCAGSIYLSIHLSIYLSIVTTTLYCKHRQPTKICVSSWRT